MFNLSAARLSVTASLLALAVAAPAAAEVELKFYTGYQTSPHSRIEGSYGSIPGNFDELIGWEGKSFDAPLYYGLRATWWRDANWGYGVEMTHAKVYAPEDEMTDAGFDRLEFTDGLNIVTVNVMRRWQDQWGSFTPYAGAGIGFAMPHVDVTPTGGEKTYEYQLTGPAARLTAGVDYAINDQWAVFGEYQFTWSENDAELEGGGDLSTRIFTNALNVGVGFRF